MNILKQINKRIAWHATQNLLIVVGGTMSVAFAATLQWWLAIGGVGMLCLTWILLYKLELGIIEHFKMENNNEN
jgi:hypothetical protein